MKISSAGEDHERFKPSPQGEFSFTYIYIWVIMMRGRRWVSCAGWAR